jgi:hypothetical protein
LELSEDGDTTIAGINSANSVLINSSGNLSNSNDTQLAVADSAAFFGWTIALGDQSGDQMNFGRLTVNSPGRVDVFEDSSTLLSGLSNVDLLRLDSLGDISNGSMAALNVTRVANFSGVDISVGLSDFDEFNANAVIVLASGDAAIFANSSLHLSGGSAVNMSLNSEGSITNADGAIIDVDLLLSLAADVISLGNGVGDTLTFGELNFNSPGNVLIAAESAIAITGQNAALNLTLETTGNVTDDDNARTQVSGAAMFTGFDLILGDSESDCLDIFGTITAVALGVVSITEGGC